MALGSIQHLRRGLINTLCTCSYLDGCVLKNKDGMFRRSNSERFSKICLPSLLLLSFCSSIVLYHRIFFPFLISRATSIHLLNAETSFVVSWRPPCRHPNFQINSDSQFIQLGSVSWCVSINQLRFQSRKGKGPHGGSLSSAILDGSSLGILVIGHDGLPLRNLRPKGPCQRPFSH